MGITKKTLSPTVTVQVIERPVAPYMMAEGSTAGEELVGLTEKVAVQYCRDGLFSDGEKRAVRVAFRDGKHTVPSGVSMPGRLHLHIVKDKVVKVEVEQ